MRARRSMHSSAQRTMTLFGAAAIAVFAVAPAGAQEYQVGFGERGPARGSIDPRAVSLMAAVEAKMRAASTIEVIKGSTLRGSGDTPDARGWRLLKVQVKRPNMYRIEALDIDEKAKKNYMFTRRVT